jgi:hypothetical protein
MRVSTAFSRLLRLPGVWVRSVSFEPDRVVVGVALRARRLHCPKCSYSTRHRENRQLHKSVWRHLDLGVWRLEVRASLRRLRCPEHGVHVEGVPFRATTRGSPAISMISSLGSRLARTRRRSRACSGSTGGRSGGSSSGYVTSTFIQTVSTTCSRSGSTRCPGEKSTGTSRSWSIINAVGWYGAPTARARRPLTGSSPSSTPSCPTHHPEPEPTEIQQQPPELPGLTPN